LPRRHERVAVYARRRQASGGLAFLCQLFEEEPPRIETQRSPSVIAQLEADADGGARFLFGAVPPGTIGPKFDVTE
jgi:hypothetical protein